MAEVYFASAASGGSDSNTGAIDSPFLSVAKVNTVISEFISTIQPLNTGEELTIYFKGGDTFAYATPITITSGSDITLTSYGEGRATIDVPQISPFNGAVYVVTSKNVTIENLIFATSASTIPTTPVAVYFAGSFFGTAETNHAVNFCSIQPNFITGIQISGAKVAINSCDITRPRWAGVFAESSAAVKIIGLNVTDAGVVVTSGVRSGADYFTKPSAGVVVGGTAYVVLSQGYFVGCMRGVYSCSLGTTPTRIYRTFIELGELAISTGTPGVFNPVVGVETGFPTGFSYVGQDGPYAPVVLRDSIIRMYGTGKIVGVKRYKGDVTVTNCTITSANSSTDTVMFLNNVPATPTFTNGGFVAKNCSLVMQAVEPSPFTSPFFIKETNTITNGAYKYAGYRNNFAYAPTAAAQNPFQIAATTYSRSSWLGLREQGSSSFNLTAASVLSVGDLVAMLEYNAPIVSLGLDLSAEYGSEYASPLDYFGTDRSVYFQNSWTIGAYEPNFRPTREKFTEGSSAITLVSDPDIASFASYQTTHNSAMFPKTKHSVEARVTFDSNAKTAGIWLLGNGMPESRQVQHASPINGAVISTTATITADIKSTSPATDLALNGNWNPGQTPGISRKSYVAFYFSLDSTGVQLNLDHVFNNVIKSTSSITLTTTTTPQTPQMSLPTGMRLEVTPTAINSINNTCTYSVNAFVSYVENAWIPAFSDLSLTLNADNLSEARHFGIMGSRRVMVGSGGTASSSSVITWSNIIATQTTSGVITPTTPSSVARYKEYLSGRESVLNILENGGFTNYPAPVDYVTTRKAVTRPPVVPEDGENAVGGGSGGFPVHVVFCVDAGSEMLDGGTWKKVHTAIQTFLANCPMNGRVAVDMMHHGDGDVGDTPNATAGLGGSGDHVAGHKSNLLTGPNYLGIARAFQSWAPARPKSGFLGIGGTDGTAGPAWLTALTGINDTSSKILGIPTLFNRGVVVNNRRKTARYQILVLFTNNRVFLEQRGYPTPTNAYKTAKVAQLFSKCPKISDVLPVSYTASPTLSANNFWYILKRLFKSLPYPIRVSDINDLVVPDGVKPVIPTYLNRDLFQWRYNSLANMLDPVSDIRNSNILNGFIRQLLERWGDLGLVRGGVNLTYNSYRDGNTTYNLNSGVYNPQFNTWNGVLTNRLFIPTNYDETLNAKLVGLDILSVVEKRLAEFDAANTTGAGSLLYQEVTKVVRVPGRTASVTVTSEKPTESLLGAWFASGCAGSIDIHPVGPNGRMYSYDGGNVARISLAETGTLELSQTITDIKPLLGRWITAAYSGHSVRGRALVSMTVKIDGAETVLDQTPSSVFGKRLRRVASYQLPLNFKTLEFVLKFKGTQQDSAAISAVSFALGKYEKDLPFGAGDMSAIPSGTVIMYAGDACPPGYRTVPYSENRLALAVGSNPYELSVSRGLSAATLDPGIPRSDIVLLVDIGGSNYHKAQSIDTMFASILEQIPANSAARLTVIATNGDRPGEVIIPATELNGASTSALLASFRAQVTYVLSASPGFGYTPTKNLQAGLATTKLNLDASPSPNKLVFIITDETYTKTPDILTAISIVKGVKFLREISVGVIPPRSGFSAVSVPNTQAFLFPTDGNRPGVAVADLPARVVASVNVATQSVIPSEFFASENKSEVPPYIGGQEFHDHVGTSPLGSDIEDSDGFEPESSAAATTSPSLPRPETALLRGYPFGSTNTSNSEDPMLVVGRNHQHNFQSDMSALPPAFPMRFCEKL